MNKELVIITSLEDVKKTAELVMNADPNITGWEFTGKVSVGWGKWGYNHNVRWILQVLVEYNNRKPVLLDYYFNDGDYQGSLSRCEPSKNATYTIKDISRNCEYHSFELKSVNGIPEVKTTYYFHDYPWEKAKCVDRPMYCPDQVSSYFDKPVMFPHKEDIQMIESYNTKQYRWFESKLVGRTPCWISGHPVSSMDPDYIHWCYLLPHICYRTEHLLPLGATKKSKAPFGEIEIGKEYPLYQLGDCADVSTSNLLSVTFDGENFHFIRPSESTLIKKD